MSQVERKFVPLNSFKASEFCAVQLERKFIDLKSLKVRDEGPGFIEGYRSIFNTIDDGGDVVLPGAFKDTRARYLKKAFTTHSHEWSFKEAVGYPIEANEDEIGFYVVSKFHSTADAQDIRTKAKERMDDGLDVGFSFGYAVKSYEYIERKDYAEKLPQFIKAAQLAENMAKAQAFPRIRLLKSLEIYEDSLVTVPMNEDAGATGVKSADGNFAVKTLFDEELAAVRIEVEAKFVSHPEAERKAAFEEEFAARTQSLWFLTDLLECVLWRGYWQAQDAVRLGATFDFDAFVTASLEEFRLRLLALFQEETDSVASELAYSGVLKSAQGGPASGLTLEQRSAAVASAARGCARRSAVLVEAMKSVSEDGRSKLKFRSETKEGRTISQATRQRMQEAHDAMKAAIDSSVSACDHLKDLMDLAEPKGKADPDILGELASGFLREHIARLTV